MIRFVLCMLVIGASSLLSSSLAQYDTVLISALKPIDGLLKLDGKAYSGEAYFLKPEGKPMVMRSYVNGVKEGLWKTWHSNGNLYKVGTVKDSKEHGEYLEYFENGTQRYHYHYDMGKKTGKWIGWHEDGKLYTERNFLNDKLNGRLIHFDENGDARLTEEYRNGQLIASDRFKSKDGGVSIEKK